MRLFVALRLPRAVRQPLAASAARLRARLPPARWVPVENLHLTLLFLGETPAERLAGLERALAGCFASRRPFSLRLSGGGCFPPRRRARVAWVGFEPSPDLMALQAAVAASVGRQLGVEPDGRAFRPHLTLARPRRPWPRDAVASWRAAFAGAQGPDFEVAQGHLMRSHLGPAGARHELVGVYPLSATAPPL